MRHDNTILDVFKTFLRTAPLNCGVIYLAHGVLQCLLLCLWVVRGIYMLFLVGWVLESSALGLSVLTSVGFRRRSDKLRTYPGDTSLPGGKTEAFDHSLENAAVCSY